MARVVMPATLIALSLALLACGAPSDSGFKDVRAMIAQRSGEQAVWRRNRLAEKLVADALRKSLVRPLTLQVARKIALLNSPALQAHYEQLGIGQAELVQAGMLKNPQLGFAFGASAGGQASAGVGLGFDFLALFTRAARKRVAAARFEALKRQVAAGVFGHLANVEKTFRRVQAARLIHRLAGQAVLRRQAHASLLQRGSAESPAARRVRARRGLRLSQAYLRWLAAADALSSERENLNRLMGLWGANIHWQVDANLPGLPDRELSLERVESLAIARRLDLMAARERSRMWVEALKMAQDWAWLGRFDAGVLAVGLPTHPLAMGPGFGLELPIFDRGEARRAYLRSALRKSWHEVSQLAVAIRSDARRWRRRLLLHRRRLLLHREMVMPAARLLAKTQPSKAEASALQADSTPAAARSEDASAAVLPMDSNGPQKVAAPTAATQALRPNLRDMDRYHQAEQEWVRERCAYWIARAELRRVAAGPLPLEASVKAVAPVD